MFFPLILLDVEAVKTTEDESTETTLMYTKHTASKTLSEEPQVLINNASHD